MHMQSNFFSVFPWLLSSIPLHCFMANIWCIMIPQMLQPNYFVMVGDRASQPNKFSTTCGPHLLQRTHLGKSVFLKSMLCRASRGLGRRQWRGLTQTSECRFRTSAIGQIFWKVGNISHEQLFLHKQISGASLWTFQSCQRPVENSSIPLRRGCTLTVCTSRVMVQHVCVRPFPLAVYLVLSVNLLGDT